MASRVFRPEVIVTVGPKGGPLWAALGGENFEAALGNALAVAGAGDLEAGLAAVAAAVGQAEALWDSLPAPHKWGLAAYAKGHLRGANHALHPQGDITDVVQSAAGAPGGDADKILSRGVPDADAGVRRFLRDIQRAYIDLAHKLSGVQAPAGVMAHGSAGVSAEIRREVAYGDIKVLLQIRPISLSGREETARSAQNKFTRASTAGAALRQAARAARSPEVRQGLLAASAAFSAAMSPEASPELRGIARAAAPHLVSIAKGARKAAARGLTPGQGAVLGEAIGALRSGTFDADTLGGALAALSEVQEQQKIASLTGLRERASVAVPKGIEQLSRRLAEEQKAGGDITQAATLLQEAQDALSRGDLAEAKTRLGMAVTAAPDAVAAQKRQERAEKRALGAQNAESKLRADLQEAIARYGERAPSLVELLGSDLSTTTSQSRARMAMREAISGIKVADIKKGQEDAALRERDAVDKATSRERKAAAVLRNRGQRIQIAARKYVAAYGGRVPESVSKWADAPPGNELAALRAEHSLGAFAGELELEKITSSAETKRQKIEDKLESVQSKAADLPEGAQPAIFRKIQDADALLAAGDLDGAERAARGAEDALRRAREIHRQVTGVFLKKGRTARALKSAATHVSKAGAALADMARVTGKAPDPKIIQTLNAELAKARTPEEAAVVIEKARGLATEARFAVQEARAGDAAVVGEATFEKVKAEIRRRTADFDNKFEELRKASPSKAKDFAVAQERRRAFEKAYLAEGASDTDRAVAKKGIEAEEANMRRVLARAKPELEAYRDETGRMARLGKSIALTRGVGALVGLAGAAAAGPQALGAQAVGAAAQLGGALQNFGVSKFVNGKQGFRSPLGWAAFLGGTALAGVGSVLSSLYGRGSSVLQRGMELGDMGRAVLPSWYSKYGVGDAGDGRTLLGATALAAGVDARKAMTEDPGQIAAALTPSTLFGAIFDGTPSSKLTEARASLVPGNVYEYQRRKLLTRLEDRYGNFVGPRDFYAALGASNIGRLGNVFRGDQTYASKFFRTISYGNVQFSEPEWARAPQEGLDGQFSEAAAAAYYARRRGRDVATVAGISDLAGRARTRLRGLRGLAPLTGTEGLGFVGDTRDTVLKDLLEGLRPAVLGGYRADLTGDVRMAYSAARRGVDPSIAARFAVEGGQAAVGAAGRYAAGFGNLLETASDVMAYERSGTGDPAAVARARLGISESDRIQWAAKNFGRENVQWALQAQGLSPEDASRKLEAAFDAGSADADPKDEEVSFFDEVARRGGYKNMEEFTAAVNEKGMSDAEREARAAKTLDEAAASFAKSVDRFGTSVINLFS